MYEGTFPALLCHVNPAIFFWRILTEYFPIIFHPTPPDALEIAILSGREDRMRA
jgi:hypothetical protein